MMVALNIVHPLYLYYYCRRQGKIYDESKVNDRRPLIVSQSYSISERNDEL